MNVAIDAARITAADIPWGVGGLAAPAPWPDHSPVIREAVGSLPAVVDDDSAAAIEYLLEALVARGEELRSLRLVMSVMGTTLHETTIDLQRIRTRYHALLDERRAKLGPS